MKMVGGKGEEEAKKEAEGIEKAIGEYLRNAQSKLEEISPRRKNQNRG